MQIDSSQPTRNWPDILVGESLLFGLLARAFAVYTDREWLTSLVTQDVFSESPVETTQPGLLAGLATLQSWSRSVQNGISDEAFEALKADYTRLFLGPATPLAPPWESYHLSKDHELFQEQTMQVRQTYARFGLQVANLNQEPDDHIGLEFGLIAHLAGLSLHALRTGDKGKFETLTGAQHDFLQDHLSKFGLAWCELVQKHARTEFHRGMAQLARGAILLAAEWFDAPLSC